MLEAGSPRGGCRRPAFFAVSQAYLGPQECPGQGACDAARNRNQNSRSSHLGSQVPWQRISSTSHLAEASRQGGVLHGTQPLNYKCPRLPALWRPGREAQEVMGCYRFANRATCPESPLFWGSLSPS